MTKQIAKTSTELNIKSILFLLFLPLIAFPQKNYPALLDSFMKAKMTINNFNGNVLVAKSGKIVFQKSFGYRNYDTKELLDSNSVFELASVTKQFTALCILQLKEKGLLKLTDTLRKFFPELPYYNITITQMLTHTSGLPAYEDAMMARWDRSKIAFNKDMIQFFAKEQTPVMFKPGTKWEYSNTAYTLLASIIEKISGMTYADYLQKNIFKPLGMTNSRVYNTRRSLKDVIPNYAYGFVYSDSLQKYILPDGVPEYEYVRYLDGLQGDGTINSTTGDLLKWDRALKNHTLLNVKTQKEMLSPQSIEDSIIKLYYGYGVFLGKNELGNYIKHSGGWPGYGAVLIRYLDQDITIIILSNNDSYAEAAGKALGYIMHDFPVVVPYVHKTVSIDSTLYDKYLGKYSISQGAGSIVVVFYKKNGKLMFKKENDPEERELIPESNTKFFIGDEDIQYEFEIDKSGNTLKYWLINLGMKKEMKKVNN